MNVPPLTHTAKATELPLEKLAANKSLSEKEKVAEVSRQFESVLLRQILGQGRKTIFKSKFSEDSMASGVYQDMGTSQLADAISRGGSFGLARSLEAQLIRQNVNPADSEKKSKP
jgi:Rod binding domain-containing protein